MSTVHHRLANPIYETSGREFELLVVVLLRESESYATRQYDSRVYRVWLRTFAYHDL